MTPGALSLLLYLETCAVDYGGSVEACRMNSDDFAQAKKWNRDGFIKFGRIYSKDLPRFAKTGRPAMHWVELSDTAWKVAHAERRARNARIDAKRWWRRSDEK